MNLLQYLIIIYTVFDKCNLLEEVSTFLHLVDVQWRKYPYTNCTLGLNKCLRKELTDLLEQNQLRPDFVLWSCAGGQRLDTVIKEMKMLFKNIPVFPALPPVQLPVSRHHVDYYKNISASFGDWLESTSLNTFLRAGYYSRTISQSLMLIVLNTALYCHFHHSSQFEDPGNQWQWFFNKLQDARNTKKDVYVLMSATPGVSNSYDSRLFTSKHNQKYIRMVRTFSDVIKGQFGGYEDGAKFHLFRDNQDFACGWLILSPPFYRSARLYEYDKANANPLDYVQFQKMENNWKEDYRFTKYYHVTNISTVSFQMIIQYLIEKDETYFKFMARRYKFNVWRSILDVICNLISYDCSDGDKIPDMEKDPRCNHTKMCRIFCLCRLYTPDYFGYIECLAKRKKIIFLDEGSSIFFRKNFLTPYFLGLLIIIIANHLIIY